MTSMAKSALNVTKSAVRMPKETAKKRKKTKMPESDRERLRNVAHMLLSRLEISIKARAPLKAKKSIEDESGLTPEERRYALLFGAKDSCVDTLGTLTNLLLKLEPPAAVQQPDVQLAHTPDLAMTAADMALVDNFVQRMRGGGNKD